MLTLSDEPYQFVPPRPSPVLIRVTRWLNRALVLGGRNHRIRGLELENRDWIQPLRKDPGTRLLVVSNHSTHSDPQILTEVLRRCGVLTCTMAAYDVFCRGRIQAWAMQHCGGFSVDRDGSDRESLRTAVDVLAGGRYALTIFPEGNVYFTNDRPAPFLEGAAFIALKAQKALNDTAAVTVVPISIKATHLTDQRPAVRQRIETIAETLGTTVHPETDLLEEFKRVGLMAMERNLHQRGILPEDPSDELTDTVRRCAEQLIEDLEQKTGLSPKSNQTPVDRIRRIRGTIHQVRTDPERSLDHPAASAWADEAMLAMRLLGYTMPYLEEDPTLDRFAETTERFLEDLYAQLSPPFADRFAYTRINQPIRLPDLLAPGPKGSRQAVESITQAMESAVQDGLDHINTHNPHPGGKPFNEPSTRVGPRYPPNHQ